MTLIISLICDLQFSFYAIGSVIKDWLKLSENYSNSCNLNRNS